MKECKGIGKCHGIKGCGTLSDKRRFGLCPSCLFEWATTNDNGKVWYSTQFLPKVAKNAVKHQKKRNKEVRESMKSISRLIQEARTPFQKWIRQRDANDSCISCGATNVKIWHAGHYLKAELYTGLIFNEMNVNKQCEKCNTFGGGNESGYRIGLVKKYGEKKVKELEESANYLRQYKFDKDEIRKIKREYQKLIT